MELYIYTFGTFGTVAILAAVATGDPPESVSAQLRHLRKERFGSHTVEKKYLGDGLYVYRLIVNVPPPAQGVLFR